MNKTLQYLLIVGLGVLVYTQYRKATKTNITVKK